MTDIGSDTVPIRTSWQAFGSRAAAAAGALTALTSLAGHTPVWVACARGGSAWLAVWVVARTASWLLRHTQPPVRSEASRATARGATQNEHGR